METQSIQHQDGISYEEAIKIAEKFAKEIADIFPGKVEAVFAIGSLGSDPHEVYGMA